MGSGANLILPEEVGVKQRRRNDAVEQTRWNELLVGPGDVGRVDLVADDDDRSRVRVLGVRVSGAVPLPPGPRVVPVLDRGLHVAQGVVDVGGVLQRAVEATTVRHDVVDLNDAEALEHEDLLPRSALLRVNADHVGHVRVRRQRVLGQTNLL